MKWKRIADSKQYLNLNELVSRQTTNKLHDIFWVFGIKRNASSWTFNEEIQTTPTNDVKQKNILDNYLVLSAADSISDVTVSYIMKQGVIFYMKFIGCLRNRDVGVV